MHCKVSVRNAVAVEALTVQTCRRVTFAVKYGPKAVASNQKKVANPEVKAVAKTVVVIVVNRVENHVQKVVARVAQSAPSAQPVLTTAHQVPPLQK